MGLKLKQRRGIGNVITTLIILIASVVLGAGVVLFGGSMFETNAKQVSMQITNSHVWASASGPSIAAFVVQNTGDTPLTIEKITLRGQAVPMDSWYYNNSAAVASPQNIMTELRYDASPGSVNVDGNPGEEQFTQATGALTLHQGQAMFLYLENPANISMMDAGFDISLGVHADRISATKSVHVAAT